MHILGDVEEVFMKGFIRRLDGDQSVIIDVFNESAKAITAIEGIDMKLFEAFIEGISEDEVMLCCQLQHHPQMVLKVTLSLSTIHIILEEGLLRRRWRRSKEKQLKSKTKSFKI